LEKGVGVTSEDYFDDKFWQDLHLCWNALDNVIARKYTDRCCLWYGKPLLESGTLGTKSNSDVFLPNLTKSYNDGTESDANENQIAMCTLRSFPYLPLHCIEFAKAAYFSDYMEFAPNQYESFRKDRVGFFEQLDAMSDAEQFKALKMIKSYIELQKGAGKAGIEFSTCIQAAFKHFCNDFVTSIRNLLYSCDEIEKSSGKPFWTGTKRRPTLAKWNPMNPPSDALEYLYATANCYAFIWKVPHVRNREDFERHVVAMHLEVPEWSPPGGEVKVDTEEDDGDKVDSAALEALKGELYSFDTSGLQPCEAHDFEKDDDTNFHIDFLTVGTNLRSANYDIKKSERSTVKVTAGRIIPALATTTAMICGLVDVEFMKLVRGCDKEEGARDKFYAANVNLATGSVAMNVFRPEAAIKKQTQLAPMPEYTSWDKVDIKGDISLQKVVEELEHRFKATVVRLYPAGNDKICLYERSQLDKLNWKIDIVDGKVVLEPEAAIYGAWPQLRMAVTQLAKLPAGGAARKMFEGQVQSSQKSLASVKDTFQARYQGMASKAYVELARPREDEEKQKYFDAVLAKRSYVALQVHVQNEKGEDAELPTIRYIFR
jgi:ubiquitin-activating enzyme E1